MTTKTVLTAGVLLALGQFLMNIDVTVATATAALDATGATLTLVGVLALKKAFADK